MLKIQTNRNLKDFLGADLENGEGKVKLGTVLANVMAGKVENPTLGWILGKKFATDKEVELKAEEVVFVKKEVEATAKAWMSSLIAGQILEILDGKDEETKKDSKPRK